MSVGQKSAAEAAGSPKVVGPNIQGKCEEYRLERQLQNGLFGGVYEARGISSGRAFAVKVLHQCEVTKAKNTNPIEFCEVPLSEIKFMDLMRGHDNVMQVEDYFEDQYCHYIVFELAVGGDLLEALKLRPHGFEEHQAQFLVGQAAMGLARLHQHHLAMQDVSLENMLIHIREDGQYQIKICDPGQAIAFETDAASGEELPVNFRGFVGKSFRPPEICLGRPYLASKVDAWCLGWSTFYLVAAQPLFLSADPTHQDSDFELFKNGDFIKLFRQKGASCSQPCMDFILRLMQHEPKRRMSVNEALKHEWLMDSNVRPLYGPKLGATNASGSNGVSKGTTHVGMHGGLSRSPSGGPRSAGGCSTGVSPAHGHWERHKIVVPPSNSESPILVQSKSTSRQGPNQVRNVSPQGGSSTMREDATPHGTRLLRTPRGQEHPTPHVVGRIPATIASMPGPMQHAESGGALSSHAVAAGDTHRRALQQHHLAASMPGLQGTDIRVSRGPSCSRTASGFSGRLSDVRDMTVNRSSLGTRTTSPVPQMMAQLPNNRGFSPSPVRNFAAPALGLPTPVHNACNGGVPPPVVGAMRSAMGGAHPLLPSDSTAGVGVGICWQSPRTASPNGTVRRPPEMFARGRSQQRTSPPPSQVVNSYVNPASPTILRASSPRGIVMAPSRPGFAWNPAPPSPPPVVRRPHSPSPTPTTGVILRGRASNSPVPRWVA